MVLYLYEQVAEISKICFYQIFAEQIDLSQVRQQLRDFGVWAPAVFIFLYTVGTIFIPSTPFMVVAGILFGFGYGLLYSVIGGFLSSILVFIIARKLGKGWVESILKNKHLKYINKYNKRLENGATWDLIFLRMTPIMPFNKYFDGNIKNQNPKLHCGHTLRSRP